MLEAIGDVLSAPRRGLWSMAGMGMEALGQEGAMSRALRSGSGSQVASALFGTDPDSWAGWGAGLAAETLGDPLTYLGGFLGRKAGQALFSRVGPRYGADPGKLANLALPAESPWGAVGTFPGDAVADVARSASPALLHEIPPGSKFLGAGAEALALRTPRGDVLRIARHNPRAAVGVPDVDGIIQPTRRVVRDGFEVSRLPMAESVGDPSLVAPLRERLARQGVDFFDQSPGNVGLVGGRPAVIDLGAYDTDLPFRELAGRAPRKFTLGGALGGSAMAAALGRGASASY